MFKFSLINFSVISLFTLGALADTPDLTAIDAAVKSAEKTQSDAKQTLTTAQTSYKTDWDTINKDQKQLDNSGYKYDAKTGRYESTCIFIHCPTDAQIAQANVDLAKTKLDLETRQARMNDDLTKLHDSDAALKKASAKLQGQTAIQSASKDTDAAINRAFQKRLDGLELTAKFQDLKGDDVKLGAALNAVQAKLDNSVLGAYFEDKIGQLLNSDLFCDTVKNRCGQKPPQPVGDANNKTKGLQEIFPDMKDRRTAKEYWDMQHQTPASGGGGSQNAK